MKAVLHSVQLDFVVSVETDDSLVSFGHWERTVRCGSPGNITTRSETPFSPHPHQHLSCLFGLCGFYKHVLCIFLMAKDIEHF